MPLTGSDACAAVDQAGLKIVKTPGNGECFFHCVRNHLRLFCDKPVDDLHQMREKCVNYLRFDDLGIRFRQAFLTTIDISMWLRPGDLKNPATWPNSDCYHAISNLYNLRVTVFSIGPDNAHAVYDYWPCTTNQPNDYPPVPSADWLCVFFRKAHFDLVLPKEMSARPGKRKFQAEAFITPDKSGKASCRCKGDCGGNRCVCLREGRACSAYCHPHNTICENRA